MSPLRRGGRTHTMCAALSSCRVEGLETRRLLSAAIAAFGVHQTFGVGVRPFAVVAADVNADGRLDLVTANRNPSAVPGSVSVLLGNGNGTFQPQQTSPPAPARCVAVADFNGDGKPDLVTANSTSGQRERAARATATARSSAQPDVRRRVASRTPSRSADFNGDGKTDLVVANYGGNSVERAAGQRQRHVPAARRRSPSESGPRSVAVADVNGDGKPDLAGRQHEQRQRRACSSGNGNGTFQPQVTFAAGLGPIFVAVGGRQRRRPARPGRRQRRAAEASACCWATATARFQPQQAFAVGHVSLHGGGGRRQRATANPTSSSRNFNSATPSACCWATATGRSRRPASFATGVGSRRRRRGGDVNGDGRADLVVSNYNEQRRVSVLLGNGDGTFRAPAEPCRARWSTASPAMSARRSRRPPSTVVDATHRGAWACWATATARSRRRRADG